MIDLQIRTFQDGIYSAINSSNLPLEVKRLVLFEVYQALRQTTDREIESQRQSQVQAEEGEQ